ncbi:cell filamentation protein Fic, partial [Streptococcus hyointestinalis]
FDDFHSKGQLAPMVNLFAKYVNERLDDYLSILD